jgi:4'-phosphopantetheinyl transferase
VPRLQRLETVSCDGVDVWLGDLDALGGRADLTVLSEDERLRAGRFRFVQDRHRFAASRALLRRLLGRALGLAPGAIRFEYGAYGKPRLAGDAGPLWFNLSHAGRWGLFAVSAGEVGVDLESVRPLEDLDSLAGTVFSTGERAALSALPSPQRVQGFFNGWTRKEAYVKARGDGLSRALDGFDVTVAPGDPPRLLRVAGEPDEPARWALSSFEPLPGYVAAMCVERASRARGGGRSQEGAHGT